MVGNWIKIRFCSAANVSLSICPQRNRRVSHLVLSPPLHRSQPPRMNVHCYCPRSCDPHSLASVAVAAHVVVQNCGTHHNCRQRTDPDRHHSDAPWNAAWVAGTCAAAAARCPHRDDCGSHRCLSPSHVDSLSCAAWP